MATFKELAHSRQGTSIGVGGSQGAHMLVEVIAEESDFTKVTTPSGDEWVPPFWSGLVQSDYLPRGSLFPWDTTLASVRETFVMMVNPRRAIVRVDFASGAADALPTSDDWLISIRGASISRRLLEEYPVEQSDVQPNERPRRGTGITPAPRPERVLGTEPVEPRIIGPMIVTEVDAYAGSAVYYYNSRDKEGNEVPIFVQDTGKRKPVGYQDEIPAFTVNMTRIIPNFRLNPTAAQLAQYMKTVNDRYFRGADPGHVMVNDFSLDPVEATMDAQEVLGRAYRVTAMFVWSAERLTPWEIWPTKIDDNGYEQVIRHREDGEKVVESFRVKRTRNLEEFMRLLETGASR